MLLSINSKPHSIPSLLRLYLGKLGQLFFSFIFYPIRKQSFELLSLEVQILRLICGFLWLLTTISITLSDISLETKLLIFSFGSLTLVDVLLRSYNLIGKATHKNFLKKFKQQ